MLTLLCAVFSTAWGEEVTDILNSELIGVSGTSYSEWFDITSYSNAVYAGNSAKNYGCIQLRANGESGIVTTSSGGKVKSITVEWNSNTVDGRTLEVYGKHEPYANASELYGSSEEEENQEVQGTLLGSIVKGEGESTSLTIEGDYEYIGLRSANRAVVLTNITIVWETDEPPSKVYTPTFTPASGMTFNDFLEVSISCDTEDATIYYTIDGSDPTTEGQEYFDSFVIFETTEVKAIAVKDGLENSEIATAIYTYQEEAQEEDGIFDFSHNLSYGSGLTPSSNNYEYIEGTVTWTAGNVTLVTDGKYRYWQRNSGRGQLRIGYDNNSTLMFSVPEDMVITRIDFYSGRLHFIPDVGALTEKTWEGKSQTVTFTVTETTEISTITVYYEEFDGVKLDPQLKVGGEEDLYCLDFYNDTAILELSTQSNGEITFSYDPEGIVEIKYDENLRKYIVSRCENDYEGNIIITAEQAETETYNSTSVQFFVNVYKKSRWMLTDLADLTSDDVFVIVGTNGDGSYAMSNDKGTDFAPTAVEVTISTDGMELTSNVADNICWNISSEDDTYKFSPNGEPDKWLYTFYNNNGVRVGTKGENNEFILTEENYLFNTSTSRYIGIYNSQDWRCYESINNNIKDQIFAFYKKFEPEEIVVEFKKAAEGYSTLFYGTKNLIIPEGVKASTYKVGDDGKYVETEYENIIPKGSAVVLELKDKSLLTSDGYTVTFTTIPATETAHTDNMLYGFDEDDQWTVGPNETKTYLFYSLSLNAARDPGSIGFYWNNKDGNDNGGQFKILGHRAYLAVEESIANGASSFTFDSIGTGIRGIFTNDLPADGIYTISGVRVNSDRLQKGIYIVNGNKVVIK